MLVVDDEPRVREVLVTLISLDDHLVDTAGDGRDALDKIAAHEYDVILCDLAMPELDGPGLSWNPVEKDMLGVIGLEKLLAVERATVEKG